MNEKTEISKELMRQIEADPSKFITIIDKDKIKGNFDSQSKKTVDKDNYRSDESKGKNGKSGKHKK